MIQDFAGATSYFKLISNVFPCRYPDVVLNIFFDWILDIGRIDGKAFEYANIFFVFFLASSKEEGFDHVVWKVFYFYIENYRLFFEDGRDLIFDYDAVVKFESIGALLFDEVDRSAINESLELMKNIILVVRLLSQN